LAVISLDDAERFSILFRRHIRRRIIKQIPH